MIGNLIEPESVPAAEPIFTPLSLILEAGCGLLLTQTSYWVFLLYPVLLHGLYKRNFSMHSSQTLCSYWLSWDTLENNLSYWGEKFDANRQCLSLYPSTAPAPWRLSSSLITLQESVLINHRRHLASALREENLKPTFGSYFLVSWFSCQSLGWTEIGWSPWQLSIVLRQSPPKPYILDFPATTWHSPA